MYRRKVHWLTTKVLRFDFSHNEAMKPEEIRAVEDPVNAQIRRNLPIETNIMDLEAAKAKGAMALFGEKYDERVRVLSMGDFSTELCGGTHASRTGDIGLFRIISESGTAAGVRRIEAVTGEGAIATVHADSDRLSEVAHLLKGDSNNLADKVRSVLERTRQWKKNYNSLKNKLPHRRAQIFPVRQLMLMVLSCWLASLAVLSRKCCVPWLTI